MYVILESAWVNEDEFYPQLATDEDGRIMKFKTRKEAEKFAKKLQKGQVVEVI